MPREQIKTIAVGTPGQGSGPHLTYELLRTRIGLELVHVPYKGGGPRSPTRSMARFRW